MKNIAVLLVLYNDTHHIPALVDSLKGQVDQGFDVFAIETSTGGNSLRLLQDLYPEAICFTYKGNLGYAKGNNYLFKKAKEKGYKYAIILNSDVIIEKEFITELKSTLDENQNVALAGPLVYKGTPEGKNEIQNFDLSANFKKGITIFLNLDTPEHKLPEKTKTEVVAGCAFICKIAALAEDNLFCEDNFMYGDELDLAYRLKRRGLDFMVTKKAKVWHNHDWSKENIKGKRIQYYYMPRNRFLFFRRYRLFKELLANFLKELLLLPLKIRWAMKNKDIGLVKVYYRGIFNGAFGKHKPYERD
jgi:GT2 family glycosyltransferase